MKTFNKAMRWTMELSAAVLLSTALLQRADAQDQQDDPPSRVARLGYLEGSVSFQPAGESDWVEAAPNRPMTTGDRIWADRDSRAELGLGSAIIDVNSNTGLSFLNLDDRTELSSGSVGVRVRNKFYSAALSTMIQDSYADATPQERSLDSPLGGFFATIVRRTDARPATGWTSHRR